MASKFSVAVRTISGAQVLDQCGAVVIAGLAVARRGRAAQGWAADVCELREGYAQCILSGRGIADDVGTMSRPRTERYRAIARPVRGTPK